jgi:F-type H+-transporting ATPase subunit alpha
LFNSGLRPAINVGISVSRVGGNAQIKSMKKVAGTLKIDQAQYRELEAFSKFGSDIDDATMAVLDKGRKNVEILKQGQYSPVKVENQIAIIYCGMMGLLSSVCVEKIGDFEKEYLERLENNHSDVLEKIKQGDLSEDVKKVLEQLAKETALEFD